MTPAEAVPLVGDTAAAPRCELDETLDVMALVYNDRAPERSFAMVSEGRAAGHMVGVGSHIGGRTVIAVLPQALWLGPVDDPCWMRLAHEGHQSASKRSKSRKKRAARRKRR